MTAPFSTAELRRLSEAANHEVNPYCGHARIKPGPGFQDLIAYLGTHRDRIVALLEAADALAEADYALCNTLHFLAIPGASEVARFDDALANADEARAAYKKARGE